MFRAKLPRTRQQSPGKRPPVRHRQPVAARPPGIPRSSIRSGLAAFALSCLALVGNAHAIVNGTVVTNDTNGVVRLNIGCSGVMLNDEWVLTAQHCITSDRLENPEQVEINGVPAKRIIRHPRGSHSVYGKNKVDAALIQLSSPLPGVSKYPKFYEGSFFARDIPEECREKLSNYALAGHKILCVAFPPNGGNRWTIVTDKTFFNRNVPQECHEKMQKMKMAG